MKTINHQNFTPDPTHRHYVYRITNTLKHRFYIGKRSLPKKFPNRTPSEDLGTFYFSSSNNKGVIRLQKEEPQNWKYKIIKTFETEKEAIAFESKLHHKLNVEKNKYFYNNRNQLA